MKRLWMIISTLAIANLLAIGGLVAWLHSSDRLNKDRVQSIRTILATTITQETQAKTDAEAKVAAEQAAAAEEAKAAEPPITAEDRIAERQLEAEKALQAVLRQKQELSSLRDGLMRQLDDIERRERELVQQRAQFEADRKRFAENEGTQQFKAALSTLESQKPKDAKSVLSALLEARQVDQVVAYLTRMDESKRSKIIAEFVKDAPAVAADLLERIRTRGLNPSAAADPPASGPVAAANADAAIPSRKP